MLRLDPAHSEAGAAIGTAAGEGGALGRLLEGALGLLRVSFTDSRLIASTLLLDLLPLLLEAYSSPVASVGQRLPGWLPLSAVLKDIPLATLALTALMQAALTPAVDGEVSSKIKTTAGTTDGVEELSLLQGSRLVTSFFSSLLKVPSTDYLIQRN